ncbi:MAG: hypothetical protein ACM3ML_24675 [Micromonosporaceae bacterium]
MPCYRCGSRQVDPDREASPWKRGVRHDRQVLVCPDCQTAHDWTFELDRCGSCGGVRLIARLGEVECRECGWIRPADPVMDPDSMGGSTAEDATSGLAEEVAEALSRMFGRPVTNRPS